MALIFRLSEIYFVNKYRNNINVEKYEKDMMAPKEDIRIKIAEALDIDMSALNDIDIQTEEDAIRILFYLEEKYGLEITKRMFRNQCSLQKQF